MRFPVTARRRYRKITALDIDVAGIGDEVWLCIGTKHGELDISYDRDRISVLIDMLSEAIG